MKYLNQIVAIEKDVRRDTERALATAYHALQKPAMLEGIERVYQPAVDGGEQLPPEGVRVQATVTEMITATQELMVRLFDITAARDFTNGPGSADDAAVADVRVGEQVLVASAPVPYLIWLDKQLEHLQTFASKLPTLDPATEWTLDDPRGVYRSTPVQTARQVQQPRSMIIVPATDKHPAQATTYQENVVVGMWTTTKLSGAIPIARRAEIVQRIQALRRAVHVAREQANRAEAVRPEVGSGILSYIFD
ncbi:hypothetical protein WEH80_12555 [Actinomycetes bacterium KLBMP 9759]